MMGMMANGVDQRRVVKGHGMKRRRHKIELETLSKDLTMLTNVGWQILP